jgi:molybdopterin synthase sulfur carrier subunit
LRAMGVHVYIPSFLQLYTDKAGQDYIRGDTVRECLTALVESFPRLRPQVFDTDDRLRPNLIIYLNDSRVRPHEISRPVKEGDKLFIVHVIAGG